MAERGAPKGNTNAAKGNRWRTAIETALKKRCKSDGQKELLKLADSLIDKALEGDMQALREIGDRLDGKPAQAVSVESHNYNYAATDKPLSDDEWEQRYADSLETAERPPESTH